MRTHAPARPSAARSPAAAATPAPVPPMDAVARLLGSARHVPVNTDLVALFGLSSAYLLQQFWYWSERIDASRDGWFYKSRDEITAELSLSRKEQETARRRLVEAGVLEEERRGLPARLWYRLDFDRLNTILAEYAASHPRSPSPPPPPRSPEGNNGADKMARKLPTGRAERGRQAGEFVADSAARKSPPLRAEDDSRDDLQKTTATAGERGSSVPSEASAVRDGFAAAATKEAKSDGSREDRSTGGLADRLIAAGMNRADARRLAASVPDECERQLTCLPFVKTIRSSPGAYLRAAIEGGFAPPPAWTEAEKRRQEAEERQRRRERKATQTAAGEGTAAAAAAKAARDALWTRLRREDPQAWADLEARAISRLALPIRSRPDGPAYRPALESEMERLIRETYHDAR